MIHLLLPITLYRPEEMRVIEEYQTVTTITALYYVVQTYNPKLKVWISQAQWMTLAEAIQDAIDWYSSTNVYEVDKARERYENAEIQIVDNLKWSL